jgi:phosphoribosylamine--glycine ligase
MNILFISHDLIAGNVARRLVEEGNSVKLYIHTKQARKSFDGLVPKTDSWRKELDWVGKDGLIVFDDVGWGKIQDELRKQGYKVFGGSAKGEALELDRQFCTYIFNHYGIKIAPQYNFDDIDDAIAFVKHHGGSWVIKQNDHADKYFNFVGQFNDGRDVIDILENHKNKHYHNGVITLQQRVDGVEVGVGRYFNGKDWVGPLEINFEHKKFFPGDLGPTTSEMGTLAWYDDNEDNRLYQETLAKIKPYLIESGFIGDFEINCIVNEKGAFPLEATARFGTPIVHLHSEIHQSPWGGYLAALARGEQYDLKWRRGYGVVVLVAVPPFPYILTKPEYSQNGLNIYFDEYAKANMEHIHFEEVAKRPDADQYYISDNRGYILYVTGLGDTISKAREQVHRLINGIHIPKMMYRNDIGLKFINEDAERLRKWGYDIIPDY